MILLAALLLGGFLMYRWKKRKERQAEIEARLEAERKAKEEQRLAEEEQRRIEEEQHRVEEEQRLATIQAEQEAQQAQAEQRAQDIENDLIPEDNLTEEERQQLREKQAILKLIDEKPAEVAMLVKLWLTEDE